MVAVDSRQSIFSFFFFFHGVDAEGEAAEQSLGRCFPRGNFFSPFERGFQCLWCLFVFRVVARQSLPLDAKTSFDLRFCASTSAACLFWQRNL